MIFPDKLKPGDLVRVIAPSRSLAIISNENRSIADKRLEELGLKLTFGKNVEEKDDFDSSSIKSRVDDLHEAFADKSIKAVFTVIGGFNSNQLVRYLDWDLIKSNPKIICGYSDITALINAIYAKTGLVTYIGLHYATFSQKLYFDYCLEYFKKCLFLDEPFEVSPSKEWTDDDWYIDQEKRTPTNNAGYLVLNEGEAEGTIIGGNQCTLNLLQGTEYMPSIKNSVLFLEDDYEVQAHHFDRDLQSLIHLPDFKYVKGIVIGRFQRDSKVTDDLLKQIIKSKIELDHLPVIANVDFGHTDQLITFPVGGTVQITANSRNPSIKIIKH